MKLLSIVFITFFTLGALLGNNARVKNETLERRGIIKREPKNKQTAVLGAKTKKEKSVKEKMGVVGMEGEIGDKKISGEPGIVLIIQKYFGEDSEDAFKIAKCESNFNPQAIGDTGLDPKSYGLFQIRAFEGRAPVEELLTIEGNIREAKRIFATQGWQPWSCKYLLAELGN